MDPNLQTMFSADAHSFDPMFSGVSLQSLLSLNPSLFADGFPTLASLTDHPNLDDKKKLLIPKTEPQPFSFFPKYHRLPQLHSPDHKRHRLDPSSETSPAIGGKAPSMIPQSNLARQRRQKLSEKTRCLQKLMPWDKKMDQATLLEEAYKYVKFLQAQFCVLQSMPSQSHSSPFLNNGAVFGDLESLNRSQVLQVLVNSPVAQTMLYSQGFCVFSVEQLALLRKLSDTRQLQHRASSKTFFN
ncbi:transcription factor bHLH117 [Abrus precatorius]|uniref:Transcription factor bHLH117 n=1 Tax=Abrus precatorius TaxID=3816 RepID=A0A8B8KJ98_ABRPR|nr:transcription factor bHLH117 [Abrus precatorius]